MHVEGCNGCLLCKNPPDGTNATVATESMACGDLFAAITTDSCIASPDCDTAAFTLSPFISTSRISQSKSRATGDGVSDTVATGLDAGIYPIVYIVKAMIDVSFWELLLVGLQILLPMLARLAGLLLLLPRTVLLLLQSGLAGILLQHVLLLLRLLLLVVMLQHPHYHPLFPQVGSLDPNPGLLVLGCELQLQPISMPVYTSVSVAKVAIDACFGKLHLLGLLIILLLLILLPVVVKPTSSVLLPQFPQARSPNSNPGLLVLGYVL